MNKQEVGSRKSEVRSGKYGTRAQTGPPIAEWQDGTITTISGYARRKLRLTLASRKWEVGTRKFVTLAPLPTSHFRVRPSSASHFRLPTSSAFAQTAPGVALGFSAKEERI